MSRDRDDRPSWRERDRRRESGSRGEERPRGRMAQERERRATRDALRDADRLFSGDRGGAEGERLARAVREAHGTSGLSAACRELLEGVGVPDDAALLTLFLDADDPDLAVTALRRLQELQQAGRLAAGAGLRSQLRVLAQSFHDEVAEAAEELLEALAGPAQPGPAR